MLIFIGHLRILLILSVVIAISVYAFYIQFYYYQVTSRYQRYPLIIIRRLSDLYKEIVRGDQSFTIDLTFETHVR
jgi:hypothetical protein